MAPAPPNSPLQGYVVAFAGAHTGHADFMSKKIADLKEMIATRGGEYSSKVSAACTHLVSTEHQYSNGGAKVTEANKHPEIKIVSYEWLSKSLLSKTKVDETPYIVASADTDQVTEDDLGITGSSPSEDKKKRSHDSVDANGRDAMSDDDSAPPSKKAKQENGDSLAPKETKDGQKAKSKLLNVPVDEHCPLGGRSRVFTGDDGTVYDVTLNQTNSSNNNNKFYRIQLLNSDAGESFTWTRWGRVGETGQSKMLGDGSFADAMAQFEQKFKDKSGNTWDNRTHPPKTKRYTFIERNYEDSSNEEDDDLPGAGKRRASKESLDNASVKSVKSKLAGPVQRLMKLIFNQQYFNDTMASLDYDANKMPLGKMNKRTLMAGYGVLKELATMVLTADPATSTQIEAISNQYFSLIPHSFGRRRPPILDNSQIIKKEIELLEALTDMQLATEIMREAKESDQDVNLMDRQFNGLGLKEMEPLDMGGGEFREIQDYLVKSAGVTHGLRYKVQDIFRIERNGEFERFGSYSEIKNSDRRLLWHGSRCTNFGGILSQGLRIAPPAAPVSGYMFGKGVYLADISTKSANYCAHYSSGNIGLLLLCEAELGKPPLKLTNSDYGAGERAKAESRLSTWGVGQTAPTGWKDASCIHESLKGVSMPDVSSAPGPSKEDNAWLQYNEYIVYDEAQVRMRYLLRVEIL